MKEEQSLFLDQEQDEALNQENSEEKDLGSPLRKESGVEGGKSQENEKEEPVEKRSHRRDDSTHEGGEVQPHSPPKELE